MVSDHFTFLKIDKPRELLFMWIASNEIGHIINQTVKFSILYIKIVSIDIYHIINQQFLKYLSS